MKWEYRTEVCRHTVTYGAAAKADQVMQDLGRQGWEMVSHETHPVGGEVTMVFKRVVTGNG